MCAAVAVTALAALALGCVPSATAEGTSATRTRPLKLRRSAAVQSSTPDAGASKQSASKPVAAKPGTTRQGSTRQGAKSSMGAGEKRSGVDQPGTRSSDSSAAGKTTPHHRTHPKAKPQEDDDLPMLEQVRARHGRGHTALHRAVLRRGRVSHEPVLAGPAMSLRGTHDVLVHQNVMADDEGLERIQTDADLERLRSSHDLIDLTDTRSLHVNPELPDDRRCARPWTVQFANDLSRDFYQHFGAPLQLTSAARSVEYQRHLAHFNGNAAGVDGETSSPHLTGQAIDLGKKGMTRAELAWMRARLLPLMQAGKIDVEEEFRQACFHVSVYRTYASPAHEFASASAITSPQP